MIGLILSVFAQSSSEVAVPFMTKDEFVETSMALSERKRELSCDFRDSAGKPYKLELVQTGGYRTFLGGYPETRPQDGLETVTTPAKTEIIVDDSKLWSSSDIPFLNGELTKFSTRDRWQAVHFTFFKYMATFEDMFPVVIGVVDTPPSPIEVGPGAKPPVEPVKRAGSMVGFCSMNERRQPLLSFEELDRIGRKHK